MNIFATNYCPHQSAIEHCKVHVVKMILESAQMLSTAHWIVGDNGFCLSEKLYKRTHENHPSTVWVRQCSDNYNWLYNMFCGLCDIYELESGRKHMTDVKLRDALTLIPTNISKQELFSLPTPAMPDEFKIDSDVTLCYHSYLRWKFNDWKTREKPMRVDWTFGKPRWYHGK